MQRQHRIKYAKLTYLVPCYSPLTPTRSFSTDRPSERVRRLAHRRPTEGRATCSRPRIRRALVEPGFCQVIGEQLGLGFDDSRKPLLEHPRNASVQLLAPGLEQRLIGGVLDQRVLETVGRVERAAAAKHEL